MDKNKNKFKKRLRIEPFHSSWMPDSTFGFGNLPNDTGILFLLPPYLEIDLLCYILYNTMLDDHLKQ